MHNDETVWTTLKNGCCSFKRKILTDTFCRNPYNVTGLCNRVSCPLANGYYATVIEDKGSLFLCLKTVERIHMPRKTWEKIKLPSEYEAALKVIDAHMTNVYKGHQINRCKLRLTRLRQTLIRMRKLQLQPQVSYVPFSRKTERREAVREKKAEIAARVELTIEEELLNRLKAGVYGGIYNFDSSQFNQLVDDAVAEQDQIEAEDESDGEVTVDGEDLEEEDDEGDVFVDEEDYLPDVEDLSSEPAMTPVETWRRSQKRRRKLEYELISSVPETNMQLIEE